MASTGNCAARYGGGIYYYPAGGGRMRMTGGDVSGNCAGNNGGGLFCTATQGAGTVFAISGGTIQDNRAEVGGGLYAAYGRLELTGGFIDGNTASEGGGIAANGTAEGSRMRGGRLTENTAQTGRRTAARRCGPVRPVGRGGSVPTRRGTAEAPPSPAAAPCS